MNSDFHLLMLSAMYENGGNTVHRFLDGHPQMYVYPFESQLGTRLVTDHLSSMFPVKYRWPVFAMEANPYQDYRAMIDEECKVRIRTPQVSKFRHMPFDLSDNERCEIYQSYVNDIGRSRPNNIAAFFRATFNSWKDYRHTGKEVVYVGYSPIIVVDTDKILNDFKDAHILHIVRNPWSAYADTKKRPIPLSLENYMLCWIMNQYYALLFREKFPNRVHIIRVEDLMANSFKTLCRVCEKLGLESSESLKTPSWNGLELKEVYPWGMIRQATPEANRFTADELSSQEIGEIRTRAWQYLEVFDYKRFI